MKYAVAVMDINPAEFWDLTLAEFNIAMEAYMWKRDQTRLLNAEHALWIVSPHVDAKKMPSPAKLAGLDEEVSEEERKEQAKQDAIAMKEEMRARG